MGINNHMKTTSGKRTQQARIARRAWPRAASLWGRGEGARYRVTRLLLFQMIASDELSVVMSVFAVSENDAH
jgi:hypothetical protein